MTPLVVRLPLTAFLVYWFLAGLPVASAAPEGAESPRSAPETDALRQRDERPDLDAAQKAVVTGTNDFRRKHDLAEVKVAPQLARTARDFARFMAKTGRYGHRLNGTGPADRARKHGYDYCVIAENIGRQFDSRGFSTEGLVSGFVQGWKRSPGHRKNMLDPNVTEIGVGIARSTDTGYYYAVQLFGRPRSASISFRLKNETETTVEYQVGEEAFRLPPRYRRTHQLCQPEPVRFPWGADREVTTVNPSNGVAYRIVHDEAGRLQLKTR